jgi:cysteine dioxygenase
MVGMMVTRGDPMTLDTFFATLDRHRDAVPIDELVRLLEALAITRADVEPHVSFAPEGYKRNVLRVGPGYAALVLCWRPDQASPIHDHRGSACGVLVLDGTLAETKYERRPDGHLRETTTGRLAVGTVCGSYDADIHTIRNAASRDLVTLHVYTPPMQNYRIYELGSTAVEVRSDEETLAALAAMP